MSGTATHKCEECGTKTTHQVGQVEIEGERHDALRCVQCGAVVLITITDGD